MPDEEAKAIGLRAVARMGRWLPGVLAHHGDTLVRVTEVSEVGHSVIGTSYDEHSDAWRVARHPPRPDQWPDLRDPATMGAALALWQAHPGYSYEWRGAALNNAALYGLTDRRTIVALVEATEAAPASVQP